MQNVTSVSEPTGSAPAGGWADQPDAAVIERSWTEAEDFAEIFNRHADEIYRYVVRRVDHQAAGDVVADVFLAAFRNRLRYQTNRLDARPWLYGIATRVISDHQRASRRQARLVASLPGPWSAELGVDDLIGRLEAQRLRPALLRALDQLPAADRELVLLVAWAELSYAEAALALGIPQGTVRSRLHRARAKLRKALESSPTSNRTDTERADHG